MNKTDEKNLDQIKVRDAIVNLYNIRIFLTLSQQINAPDQDTKKKY